ncbi:MAG: DUF5071 domain-containing protein [Bacteroidia bacterium]
MNFKLVDTLNPQTLIPQHKSDLAAVEKLGSYPITQIETIIPSLAWIQDMNWPVAKDLAAYFRANLPHLTNPVIAVLHGNDDIWKYNCLLLYSNAMHIDAKLLKIIKNIAVKPTAGEIEEGVQEIALRLIGKMDAE